MKIETKQFKVIVFFVSLYHIHDIILNLQLKTKLAHV